MAGNGALDRSGRPRRVSRLDPRPYRADRLVETRFSGISRGHRGAGLARWRARGRARPGPCAGGPGSLPFPVKYGYAAVGTVIDGPAGLAGRDVFVLHPHQDRVRSARRIGRAAPERGAAGQGGASGEHGDGAERGVGRRRAARLCMAVVGAGVVGALVAWLCGRLPGAEVTLVDVDPDGQRWRRRSGSASPRPRRRRATATSRSIPVPAARGSATALVAAGVEANVVEASWHGDRAPAVGLGGAFHSRRLRLISSQVGLVPAGRRARWSNRRRRDRARAPDHPGAGRTDRR